MSTNKFHTKSTALEVIEGHNLTGYETIVTGGSLIIIFIKTNLMHFIFTREIFRCVWDWY
jgi:hypothetical protein